MTRKQRILAAIEKLSDDATFNDVFNLIYLLQGVEEGLRQADAGDVISHEEFMTELAEEERAYCEYATQHD